MKLYSKYPRLAVGLDTVERLYMRVADLAAIDAPVTVIRGSGTDPLHARLSELVAEATPAIPEEIATAYIL